MSSSCIYDRKITCLHWGTMEKNSGHLKGSCKEDTLFGIEICLDILNHQRFVSMEFYRSLKSHDGLLRRDTRTTKRHKARLIQNGVMSPI
jgi:hypothetical protein